MIAEWDGLPTTTASVSRRGNMVETTVETAIIRRAELIARADSVDNDAGRLSVGHSRCKSEWLTAEKRSAVE